ncbi:MAG: hypothetical protein IH602_07940 [Bryobacteraceae bacterium]|nr:hypothetical protein [Bryobacteraceae bacterium]
MLRSAIVMAMAVAPLGAQMRLDLSMPANQKAVGVFEDLWRQKGDGKRQTLDCKISTVPPSLGFDLRLWAGYTFNMPLTDFKGQNRARLSAVIRLEPLEPAGKAVYLGRRLTIPRIPDEPPKRLFVSAGGGFVLGAGRYRASLMIADARGRWCAKSWTIKAKEPRGGASLLSRGEVADAYAGWVGFRAPEEGEMPRRATVVINAFPVTRRRHLAALSWRDQSTLMNVLGSLLSRGGYHSARVVAVDLLNRQVVYDEPRFAPGSFDGLADALGTVNLATVDYQTLAQGPSEHQFLESVVKEISNGADPGEIVFITPPSRPPRRAGVRDEGVWEGLRRPAVLALLPRPVPEGTVIDVAKRAKGRIFSIYTPSDLASAVERMSSGRP